MPDGLTVINSYLFEDFDQFTSLTLNDDIIVIASWAFRNCDGLTVLNLDCVQRIHQQAFYGCSSLVTLTIGEEMTSIWYGAFDYCTSLETINLNAIALQDASGSGYAFSHAGSTVKGLTLNIGSKVTRIPKQIFGGLGTSTSSNVKIIKIARSDTKLEIANNAFACCTLIQEIYMSCRVSMIGDGAFAECRTDLYLDGEIEVYYDNTSSYRAQYMIMGSNNTLTNSSQCIWRYNSTW